MFCFPLNNFPDGRDYQHHGSYLKWQRKDDADSPWMDVVGTEKTFQVCPLSPDEPGEYRLVGDVTFSGERDFYASENTFVVE